MGDDVFHFCSDTRQALCRNFCAACNRGEGSCTFSCQCVQYVFIQPSHAAQLVHVLFPLKYQCKRWCIVAGPKIAVFHELIVQLSRKTHFVIHGSIESQSLVVTRFQLRDRTDSIIYLEI